MATFSHHEKCPNCAKEGKDRNGNNLGVYSDGSAYCFSCGYYKFGSVISQAKDHLSNTTTRTTRTIALPGDCCESIPEIPRNWLQQYSLTDLDILKNNILWSEQHQRLCFPIFNPNKELIAWQGRYVGDNPQKPKWVSYGPLTEILHLLGPTTTNQLILVEDIISGIRVAAAGFACLPLFGSHISTNRLQRLKYLGFVNLFIWLDKDKQIESIKFANTARQLGFNARTIITDRDPKCYNRQEIKNILT